MMAWGIIVSLLRDRGRLRHDQARHFELGASRTTGARIGSFKNAADDRCQENHYADKQQSGNYLFAQVDPERSTALIEFGGPHSSNPERPGAQLIAPINRCNYVFHDNSRSGRVAISDQGSDEYERVAEHEIERQRVGISQDPLSSPHRRLGHPPLFGS
jgi:hypothetical protein